MKVRESGMPEERLWQGFFDPANTLTLLELAKLDADIVEFGCGYGTFTTAAAGGTTGTVYAVDLEPPMLEITAGKARSLGLRNVQTVLRDFVAAGTGLPDGSMGYAMLFNILHAEQPVALLREAFRVLAPAGKVGVTHWIHDASTPRGPDLSIRPRPEQCQAWLREAGFQLLKPLVALPPYHYGILGQKP